MIDWQETLIRLLLASLFGALVGLERERKNWSAGMRTHMMVCVGSCLIMIVSAFGFSDVLGTENVELDPSRVAAQVVSGIGFIGAGTILFLHRGAVRGLTTAAGLWTVAAIGLATGGGMYLAASATTVLALTILWALQPVERRYARRFAKQNLRIVTGPHLNEIEIIDNILNENEFSVQNFVLEKNATEYVFNITFDNADSGKISELMKELRKHESVTEVLWTH